MKLLLRAVVIFLLFSGEALLADDLVDANRLFDYAEQNYGKFFSPAGQQTQTLQGYLVRYYPVTNTYLGTRAGSVYVFGQQFGVGIIRVGFMDTFINPGSTVTDLTDLLLSRRSSNCADYAGGYSSGVKDLARNLSFTGTLAISVTTGTCTFASNDIPNHSMGQGGAFATPVSAQNSTFKMTTTPAFATQTTALSLSWNSAVLLNGVRVDMLAAACYGVGDGKIGCNNDSQPWRYDPMYAGNKFGTDIHNAHTQPDGSYHYHGNPKALFDLTNASESPVVGFAADGFPVFGSWFRDSSGSIRSARPGYRLKSGSRPGGSGNPGGSYDGTYRDDYEFISGFGDLDVCNGMTVNGTYGYYITDGFPYMTNCFRGTPDSSFRKGGAGPPP